ARRRTLLGAILLSRGDGLRFLLALSCADCQTRGGAGGHLRRTSGSEPYGLNQAARFLRRDSNHATASARASRAGAGEYPSSRAAFSCETHIFFFAIRTASIGTRGGVPVRLAHAVVANPAEYARK